MATSGSFKERKRKPESVQFWLAIAAVSLLFHAGLIVGLKRWATIAVVEPDGGSIAVELVDPASEADAPPGEPIVPAAALKPEAKPAPEPIASPEPEIPSSFEPKFEPTPSVKSEPIVPPEKKPEPIVPKPQKNNPSKPIVPGPSKPSKPSQPETPTKPSGPIPLPIPTDLPDLNGNGKTRSFTAQSQQLQQQDGRPGNLALMPLPSITLSSNFATDVGSSINVSVSFIVKCLKHQALECLESSLEFSSYTPPSGLSQQYDEELEQAIEEWFKKLQVSSLTYQPDPTTDINKKYDTFWTIEVALQVKK